MKKGMMGKQRDALTIMPELFIAMLLKKPGEENALHHNHT